MPKRAAEEQQAMYDELDELGFEPFCDECGHDAANCTCGDEPVEVADA